MTWYFKKETKKTQSFQRFSQKKLIDDVLEKVSALDRIVKSGNEYENIDQILTFLSEKTLDHKLDNIKQKSLISLRPLFRQKTALKAKEWLYSNSDTLDQIVSSLGKFAIEKYAKNDDVFKYDLFLFDADKTLWEKSGAEDMEEPFYLIDKNRIKDKNNKIITLRDGIKEVLLTLRAIGKDVGLVSHSEKKGIDYQDQPVLKLLEMFGIINLFNDSIVIAADLPKSIFIPDDKKVLFIDDDVDNLVEIMTNTDADVLDAKNMELSASNCLNIVTAQEIAGPIFFTRTKAVIRAFQRHKDAAYILIGCGELFDFFKQREHDFSVAHISQAILEHPDEDQMKVSQHIADTEIFPAVESILLEIEKHPQDSCYSLNLISDKLPL